MARFARVIAVDTPHHITQRGNARRFILESDADRGVYLDLLWKYARMHRLSILGYSLMSNHVHLIAVPRTPEALPLTLKQTHGRYAAYFNTRRASNGHVWQGRYYSCALDEGHLWTALRYTEMNAVRAGMVAVPQLYQWSSAAAHCGLGRRESLELDTWGESWTPSTWTEYLAEQSGDDEAEAIRHSTHTGRPLGSAEFVKSLELSLRRRLTPRKAGRPARPPVVEPAQLELAG
jgi:putative transposase